METQEHLIRARELDPPADAWRRKRPRLEVIAGFGLGLIAAYEWGIVYGIIGGIIVAVLAYLLRVYYYWSDTIEKLQERIEKLETQNRALQSDDLDAGKADAEILARRNEEK
jgi:hypothetical protein